MPRRRCCCGSTPECFVSHSHLKQKYTGSEFDDNFILLDDSTPTADIDLTTLSANAIVMSKIDTELDSQYATFGFAGCGQFPESGTSRIILLGNESSSDDYLFFDLFATFGQLYGRAGYRSGGTDTHVGLAVPIEIPLYSTFTRSLDLMYDQGLTGVTQDSYFTACYNSSEGKMRLGAGYYADFSPGNVIFRTFIEENVSTTAGMGKRIGWSTTDWSVTGLSGVSGIDPIVASGQIDLSNDKVWETDCPECVDYVPPEDDPQECPCAAESVRVTLKGVDYVLDLSDTSPGTWSAGCRYTGQFPVSCNTKPTASGQFPDQYDCSGDYSGVTMTVNYYSSLTPGSVRPALVVSFTDSVRTISVVMRSCGDPSDPNYGGLLDCNNDAPLDKDGQCNVSVGYSYYSGSALGGSDDGVFASFPCPYPDADKPSYSCACVFEYLDWVWAAAGDCGIFTPAGVATAYVEIISP